MSFDTPVGRERVLLALKTKGPQTAARIAKRLGVTAMAVRQHLAVLEAEQLVDFTEDRSKIGRPARAWRLTPKAYDQFPDCHAELAVGMLQAVQSAFGEEGLERLTKETTRQQVESYRTRMPVSDAPIVERVATLARIRREEGYMAESRRRPDGTLELVENHCSIAKAARICSKLCVAELSLFRTVLGSDVSVERTQHILAGDRSCSYCITERTSDSSSGGLRSRRRATRRRTQKHAGGDPAE
ncbi:MAG: transcriptional regulator [Myxococcota bacterium]|nr:transcriptional regulator [Myxococcota bacterium]